ncbi:hypothetical protein [Paenibacillus illinoisensis]|uniref:hypothetical protein n=1 Tax=Paenibacillus illinoisensis TaxID=59845 RepID=UPI003D2D358F
MNIVKKSYDYSKLPSRVENTDNIVDFTSIRQLISRARFQNKPLIIVEGRDDVSVYERLARKVGKDCHIRAIETIPQYGEGCEHVKKFIRNAQSIISESNVNEKYLLGVIDRDASFFRGEDNSHLKCLLILEAYSYESHYVTRNHTQFIIESIVHSMQNINSHVVDFVESDLQSDYEDLYYISLEALSNACIKDYEGLIGYSSSYGQIRTNKVSILEELTPKKEQLEEFASLRGLDKNSLKYIAKGKWLMDMYIDSIFKKIEALQAACSDEVEPEITCPYCLAGKREKCDWTLKKHTRKETINLIVYQLIDEQETSYITERFAQLA